jgi:hypothetical protein
MISRASYRVTRQTRELGFTNIVQDNYLPAKIAGRCDCHKVVFFKSGEIIQATALSMEDAAKVCELECGAIVSTNYK